MQVRTAVNALMVCVLLIALTAPGLSRAGSERPPRDAGAPPDRFIAEHAERLGLDQETLSTIRTIVDASRAQRKTLFAALQQAHAQMRVLLSQEMPHEAAVMQQADTIGALELAARKQRLQVMLRIRALLTPAQRQELMRLQAERHTHRRPDLVPACQAESAHLCPDTAHGRIHVQCLHDHMAQLSEACRAAIKDRRGDGEAP